jgi:hypothetical protein
MVTSSVITYITARGKQNLGHLAKKVKLVVPMQERLISGSADRSFIGGSVFAIIQMIVELVNMVDEARAFPRFGSNREKFRWN